MTAKLDGTNGLLQQYDYQVPSTGFSYTFAAGTTNLVMNPAGTLATGTITMPAAPADGMTITFSSTQKITALTVNGNTGQTVSGAPTTLTAGGLQTFIYRLSNTTWYSQIAQSASTGWPGTLGQAFTTSGTFTIPSGITSVKVTVVGGGGAGGSGGGGGGGGGAGGCAISYLTGLTPGNTLSVTVGTAGNTSSVASGTQSISTISATGGSAGSGCSTRYGNVALGAGGSGGSGSGGSINSIGQGGSPSPSSFYVSNCNPIYSGVYGNGGNSVFGGGGGGGVNGANGGGGGGGASGGAGIVVFEW